MFAGSADGTYLPPMVVYKSENIYCEWVRAGPKNTLFMHKEWVVRLSNIWNLVLETVCAIDSRIRRTIALIGDMGLIFLPPY